MPKTPIDYQNTFIYKLVHKDDLDDKNIYIGHSTNFKQRKKDHRRCCNDVNHKIYNIKVYKFIRENGGWDCWNMLKVEDYPCKDVYEAKNRERYWIKELGAILNMTEPNRTSKEYYEDNKESIALKKKNRRLENIDKYKEVEKANDQVKKQKIKCDVCGCELTIGTLKRHQSSLKCLNAKKNNTE